MPNDDYVYEEYESGPYCAHWMECGIDCKIQCRDCPHLCEDHDVEGNCYTCGNFQPVCDFRSEKDN